MCAKDIGITVTIHYPDVEITNNIGDSHHIKDLFIVLIFKYQSKSLWLSEVRGFRTTFTLSEYSSGYIHSHLRKELGKVTMFCLGSGTPLSKFMNVSVRPSNKQQLEDYWIQLFNLVETYIRWESLEGGPYHYIDKINASKVLTNSFFRECKVTETSIKDVVYNILYKNPDLLSFETKGISVKIHIDKERLSNFLWAEIENKYYLSSDGLSLFELNSKTKKRILKYEENYIVKTIGTSLKLVPHDYKFSRSLHCTVIPDSTIELRSDSSKIKIPKSIFNDISILIINQLNTIRKNGKIKI